jgi:hypothetical protein
VNAEQVQDGVTKKERVENEVRERDHERVDDLARDFVAARIFAAVDSHAAVELQAQLLSCERLRCDRP